MASGIRGAGAVKPELNSVNADKFKLTAIIKPLLHFKKLIIAYKGLNLTILGQCDHCQKI